ncbi:MAG: hypothetical protein LC749_18150 [Actinobacteria bacterium]|nr:hypothetical protein [Actinomycetota bacterium]
MDELMTAARFEDIEVIDVTETFLQTACAWQEAFVERETELKALIGAEWEERQLDRASFIQGVEEGLLQRLLVTGTAPA